MQQTLKLAFSLSGPALHSGDPCRVTVHPAPVGTGRWFVRTDLVTFPKVPALADHMAPTALSTKLEADGVSVRTPEHLMAALLGMGIDNCLIELDGPELPILDGSAAPYVTEIQKSGVLAQDQPRVALRITEPLSIWDRDRFVAIFPAAELKISYGIDFPGTVIGAQWTSWVINPEYFAVQLAPARTFTTLDQVAYLKAKGLIQGGSLDCALVAASDHWVGQSPYWPDEPARHKALDLLGDLALAGVYPLGHVVAYKAGHDLHVRLAAQLRQLFQVNP